MVVLVRIFNVVYFVWRYMFILKFVLKWIMFVYCERDIIFINFYCSFVFFFLIVGRNFLVKIFCWWKLEISDFGFKYLLRFFLKLDVEVVYFLVLLVDLNIELKEDFR